MPPPFEVALEEMSCPMGCCAGDDEVLTGRDRSYNQPGEFRIVRCRACRLMRTNPRPTRAGIRLYYPGEYAPYQDTRYIAPESPAESASPWKRLIQRLLKARDSRAVPPLQAGRMLEIGCASGTFLRLMAERGWQVEGLELSERAANLAKSVGLPVYIGELETAPDPSSPYDLIVGWHVLEHLHEPLPALAKLWQWSKPGGWLALSMPDASSWEFSFFKARWYGLQLPNHLFHYTPRTLNELLTRTGWQAQQYFWHANSNNFLESLRYCCCDLGWEGMANFFLDVAQGRRLNYPHRLLGKLLGLMHASGRMTVWARRV
jgi:2-polyprenyl-3-methyl-5-hydroxy-6-metoxy-1,4-benzoquinol methylase